LARKTGLFYGSTEREKIAVDQWLMWQMGGVGPMAGQAHHFLKYAPAMDPPHDLPYPKDRYRTEVARLYGVLDRQLEQNAYVAGDFYSIADMALWPWVNQWRGQQQTLADKPHLERWLSAVKSRDAVQRGRALAQDSRSNLQTDKNAQELLFKRNA
jgi:GST-like protein